tara:strand:- start:17890 stop:19014 length:1125 start_codon:yes stop_codon:yes gene_type:complete
MAIEFINLKKQYDLLRKDIDRAIKNVLSHGKYILGPEVKEFESDLSNFLNVKHAITCANGTDALLLALMALDVKNKDAIFIPSFTFASTAEVIPYTNATPFFVDCDPDTFNMDITSLERTINFSRRQGFEPSVIIPVDLFGLAADYKNIKELANRENIRIIGDSAQGFGSKIHGKYSSEFCDIVTTSFFPAKPLGCYGDGGAIFTNDNNLADDLLSLRFHGKGKHKYENVRIGMNSRLDSIQAAVLIQKLKIFSKEILQRQEIAKTYNDNLSDIIKTPKIDSCYESVWAQYSLLAIDSNEREKIMEMLARKNIPSNIYYPVPLHLQKAYKEYPLDPEGLKNSEDIAEKIFSLPMHPYLTDQEQNSIISVIREYF